MLEWQEANLSDIGQLDSFFICTWSVVTHTELSVENYLGQFKNPLKSLDLFWASQNNQIYVQVETSLAADLTYLS